MTDPWTEPPSSLSSAQRDELLRYRTAVGLVAMVFGVVLLVVVLRGGLAPEPPPPRTLLVYSFTGLEKPLREDLLPAFSRRWEKEHEERLEIVATYAGSGWIVDRILRHFPAEVAILASSLDASRIELLVDKGDSSSTVVARSRLVLVTRPDNPFGITGFEDLIESEATVVLPDPSRSGLGRLSVLAIWGLDPRGGANPRDGEERVRRFRSRVVELSASARDARRLFEEGRGDVLLAYEHQTAGLVGQTVVPSSTIVAEHIAVRLRPRGGAASSPAAEALVDFLASAEAQERFEATGLLRSDRPLPAPPQVYRPSDLGQPRELDRKVLDRVWSWSLDGRSTVKPEPVRSP